MPEATGRLRATLQQLREPLNRSRQLLLSHARPSAEALNSVVNEVKQAQETLARCMDTVELEQLPLAERRATVRAAQFIKGQLAVVMRLVSGSAWFVSLVKEMDPQARPKGLYGRGGNGQVGPSKPSIEHKV